MNVRLPTVTDAVLRASRALVGVAARSLAEVEDDVTLPQFRALVVLAAGERQLGELAEALDVHPSSATRLCTRLDRRPVGYGKRSNGDSRCRDSVRFCGNCCFSFCFRGWRRRTRRYIQSPCTVRLTNSSGLSKVIFVNSNCLEKNSRRDARNFQ